MIGMPVEKIYRHCLRCGRKLRSRRSQLVGYGAVCEAKMKTSSVPKLFSPGILGTENEQKEKPLD